MSGGRPPAVFDMKKRLAAARMESRALRLLAKAHGHLPRCQPLQDWPHFDTGHTQLAEEAAA